MNASPYHRTRAADQLAIETLALSESELLERVADLQADNLALRETLHASVNLNHTLMEQNARLRICLKRNLWDVYGRIIERRAA